jgi:hypothetical protein
MRVELSMVQPNKLTFHIPDMCVVWFLCFASNPCVECIEEYLTKQMVLYCRIDSESQNDGFFCCCFCSSVELQYHGPMSSLYMSCRPWYEHGMNMICFSVCKYVTAHCGDFVDPCVDIWAFQYVSSYCLIFGPTCEAMKDIFDFVLTNSDKKSSMLCPSINIFGCRRDVILNRIA